MIKMGSDVEAVLRETVLQVEHVAENKLCMILLLAPYACCTTYVWIVEMIPCWLTRPLFLPQCFDLERVYCWKMCPIVMNPGKNHDHPSLLILSISQETFIHHSQLPFNGHYKTMLKVVMTSWAITLCL